MIKKILLLIYGLFSLFWLQAQSPGGVSTNLVGWYSADVSATATTWTDRSPAGNNLTGTSSPTFANLLNFNRVVTFNGSSQRYSIAATSASWPGTNTANTYYYVAVPTGTGTSRSVFGKGTAANAANGMHSGKGTTATTLVSGATGAGTVSKTSVWSQNVATLVRAGFNGGTTGAHYLSDNGATETAAGSSNPNYAANSAFAIGSQNTAAGFWDGDIAEVIAYSGKHAAADFNRIESYLALKYGITKAGNYINSASTTVWTSGAGYDNNIAGIGRDDMGGAGNSGLSQKQSQSQNSGIQPVIGNVNISDTNANNTNNFTADLSALVWGSDTGSTAFATSFVFGGVSNRMARIWRVQETGTVGTVKVALAASDLPVNIISPTLVVSSDAVFNGSDTRITMTLETLGGVQYYTATVDFTTGQFFTFAGMVIAPGGVTGASLWLRSDIGVSSSSNLITGWSDIAGVNTFSFTGSVQTGTRMINFNNTAYFNGASNLTGNAAILFKNGYGAYAFDPGNDDVIISGTLPNNTTNTHYFFRGRNLAAGDGAADGGITYVSTTTSFGELPVVVGMDIIAGSPPSSTQAFLNGGRLVTQLFAGTGNMSNHNSVPHIGRSNDNAVPWRFTGRLGDVIMYPASHTNLERLRINTYLAIKYGTTLSRDNNGNGTAGQTISGSVLEGDYVASDGTTRIWNSDATYQNNIAGIARDDASGLNQKQSQSQESGIQPVIGNGNIFDTNANNTNNFSADISALVWGSDTGTTSFATSFVFGSLNARMTRIWKVQETGTVGTVKVALRASDLAVNVASPFLVVSSDAVFDGTDTRTALTLETLGGVQYYTATVDFTSGQFFTFAAYVTAPGGVLGSSLWVKANTGTSTITDGAAMAQWDDQSTSGNNVLQGTAANQPQYRSNSTDNVNFNPVISFDGSNDFFSVPSGFADFTAGLSLFSMHNFTSTGSFARIMDFSNGTASDNIVFARNGTTTNYISAVYNGATATSFATSSGSVFTNSFGFTNWNQPGGVAGATISATVSFNGLLNTTGSLRVPNNLTRAQNYIGRSAFAADAYFAGYQPELVLYQRSLTATEQQRVNSYLAIKYGSTLGTSASPLSYLASDGVTTIWTADAAYQNNMAGIARDDASALNQKQSQSQNSGIQPVIANGNIFDTNANNTNNFTADLSALVWGSNTGSTAFATSFVFGGVNNRMARIWKVQETGTVGTVKVALRATDLPANLTSPALVVSADAVFDGTDTRTALTLETLGGVQYYTATVDFSSGQFFTFAGMVIAPGGVTGASLWLRSDIGVSSSSNVITGWSDIAGVNTFSFTGSVQTGTRMINFNNTAYFNGSSNLTGNAAILFKNGYGAYDFDAGNIGTLMSGTIPNNTNTNYFFQGRNLQAGDGAADGAITYVGTTTSFVDMPVVVGMDIIAGAAPSSTLAYVNGTRVPTQLISGTGNMSNHNSIPHIGRSNFDTSPVRFMGRLGDIIMYPASHTNLERLRINTYLAIKYGTTLSRDNDGNGTSGEIISGSILEGDYVASNGTTRIWNSDATYQNNIAGIARDDASALNQKQSQSQESGIQPVIGNGNIFDTNANNTNNFSADLSALVWGSDTGSSSFETSFVFGGLNARMTRIWRVQETGTVGTVKVALPASQVGGSTSQLNFVVSADATFDGTDTRTAMTLETLGGVQYYTATVDFTTGQFFTFAAYGTAPGGVSTGLRIWHKADAGVTAASNLVTAWTNQADGRQVINSGGTQRPTLVASGSLFNFNPYLDFTAATNALYDTDATPFTTDGDISYFVSLRPAATAANDGQIFGINNPSATGGAVYDNHEWFNSVLFNSTSSVATSYSPSMVGLEQSIATFTHNGATNIANGYRNLNVIINNATVTGPLGSGGYAFGADSGFAGGDNNSSLAQFSEHIAYNRVLSATEIQRVQSYLAVKTGVSLNQNYLASDGATTLWNTTTNAGYNNNIAGIARDDASALSQKQSASINSGIQPVIGNGNIFDTNANNTNNFSADLSALVWGSDTGSTSFATSFAFGSENNRMARIWRVQETGTVGTVKVALRAADLPANLTSTALVVSADAVFDGTDTRTAMTLETLGGVQYYTATVDFTSGQFFTFATFVTAPGGVVNNLQLWVRGSDATTTSWLDRVGVNTFTATGSPVLNSSGLNFNQTVQFNGSTYYNGNTTISNATEAFAVANISNPSGVANSGAVLGSTNSNGQDYFFHTESGSFWSSGGATIFTATTAFGNNIPWSVMNTDFTNTPASQDRMFVNGQGYPNTAGGNPSPYTTTPVLGSRSTFPLLSGSQIAEVVLYNSSAGSAGRQRIISYLATKYGITLSRDNNGNGTSGEVVSGSIVEGDYVASDGTKIWNSDAAYQNNVAGIFRDDASALNQKQSASINSGIQPVIGNGNIFDTNANNTNNFTADLSALVWGSDTGSTSFATSFVFGGLNNRMARIWKVQETGTVGTVKVALRATDLLTNVTSPSLVVSADAVFDGTDTRTAMTLETLGGVQYYTATVDFTSGQFFTFAALVTAPGGVTGEDLWLKADAGTGTSTDNTAITTWADQSGNANNVSQATAVNRPVYRNNSANLMNFNPTVSFDGTNDFMDATTFTINGTANTLFSAVKPNVVNISAQDVLSFGAVGSLIGGELRLNNATLEYSQNNTTFSPVTSGSVAVAQVPLLFGSSMSNTASGASVYQNNLAVATGAINQFPSAANLVSIGSRSISSRAFYFNGLIPEVITYNSLLTAAQRQRVNSYLAIKYGITLDQSTVFNFNNGDFNTNNFNYWSSSGNVTAAAGYASFNSANTTPNGVINQSISTVNGQAYTFGGNLIRIGAGAGTVRLRLDIIDDVTAAVIATQNLTAVSGTVSFTQAFIGNGNNFSIKFTDTSTATTSVDVAVDNLTLTPNASETGMNYVNSVSGVIWDATANASYANNIAGIARDDVSALNQKQSQSVNSGIQPVIGNGNIFDTNANNTNNFSADLSALVWGSDTGSTAFATSFAFGGVNNRMARIWKVQETGTVGTVKVALPVSQLALSANTTALALVVSGDAVFDGTDTRTAMTLETLGGVQYYTATVDFTSGQFFTFAALLTAPGGVFTNLQLWLKADSGVATSGNNVGTWTDSSSNPAIITQPTITPSSDITLSAGAFNFNPALNFTGATNKRLVGNTTGASNFSGSLTIYGVAHLTSSLTDLAAVFTSRYKGLAVDNSSYFADGTGANQSTSSNTPVGTSFNPQIASVQYTVDDTNNSSAYYNGGLSEFFTGTSETSTTLSTFEIGGRTEFGGISRDYRIFRGLIPEVINYKSSTQTLLERLRINTYLGIKYGITLTRNNDGDGTSGEVISGSILEGDYVASDGTTRIWNSDAAYQNNIAGIGRDDLSALHQKQSQSVNTGSQVVMALGTAAATNQANANTIATDRQFFIWGDDNGSLTTQVSTGNTTYTYRFTRAWKTQNTGTFAQNLTVYYPVSAFGNASASTVALLYGANAASLSNGTASAIAQSGTTTINGVSHYAFTVPSAQVANMQFFSFAGTQASPGGVTGTTSWFKADAGVTLNGSNVSALANQSANTNLTQLAQPTASRQPAFTVNSWNFNPGITYDGTSDILENTFPSMLNVLNATNNEVFGALSVTGGATAKVYFQVSDNGSFTNRLSLENTITQYPTNVSSIANTGLSQTSNLPSIINFASGSGSMSYAINGNAAVSAAFSGSITAGTTPRYKLGAFNDTGSYSHFAAGNINEVTTYNRTLTTTERQRVQSYLGLKYGRTIAHNYIASDGTAITWNTTTNAGYNNNIAGIGRDDLTALYQKQSQSVNTGSQVVMALGTVAATNQANANTIPTDRQFFIWGDDNGSLSTFVSTGNTTYPSRFTRVWRAQNTGTFAQDMTVYYPVSAFGTSLASSVGLLYGSSAASLSNGSASVIPQSGTTTINGVSYYAFTVPSAQVANMQFFSFTGATVCYKPAVTVGTTLDAKHGITALSRAGTAGDNWPMVRKGAWTVLEAKTKGFVINRLTAAQIAAIPPANLVEGMMVYDTTNNCMKVYTSTDGGTTFNWQCITTQTCPD